MKKTVLSFTMLLAAPLTAHAHEIDANLGAPLPGSIAIGGPGTTITGGFAFTDRLVLHAGIGGSFSTDDDDTVRISRIAIPLELKLYLDDPVAGAVIPLLRFGVRVDRSFSSWESAGGAIGVIGAGGGVGAIGGISGQTMETTALAASALGGAAAWLSDSVALTLEAGIEGRRTLSAIDTWGVGFVGRAGLTIRP